VVARGPVGQVRHRQGLFTAASTTTTGWYCGAYNEFPGKRTRLPRCRRSRASPLFRLLDDHFRSFGTVCDERFATRWGPWRSVVAGVAEKPLECGILEQGFTRVHCSRCRHEYLLAFSCKCRYFCPSCHAKCLTARSLWLEETLVAPAPHRQVVLTVPKGVRPYFPVVGLTTYLDARASRCFATPGPCLS
jgi:hypothetical protein